MLPPCRAVLQTGSLDYQGFPGTLGWSTRHETRPGCGSYVRPIPDMPSELAIVVVVPARWLTSSSSRSLYGSVRNTQLRHSLYVSEPFSKAPHHPPTPSRGRRLRDGRGSARAGSCFPRKATFRQPKLVRLDGQHGSRGDIAFWPGALARWDGSGLCVGESSPCPRRLRDLSPRIAMAV
jgi:hypothetical protein